MIFYCPNCRKEFDLNPTGTVNTKSGRLAYKATCPVCGLDLTEFAATPTPVQILPTEPIPEALTEKSPTPDTTSPEPAPPILPMVPAATADETIKAYIQSTESGPESEATPAPNQPATEEVSAQTALYQAAEGVDKETIVEEFPIDPAP